MDPFALINAADRIGLVAFAISGVAVGIRARMDLYGLFALGVVTAIGGGVVRDVLVGDVPRAFVHVDYLAFVLGATLGGIGLHAAGWNAPGPLMKTADAVGTGAFAATGALLANEAGLHWAPGVLLAVITATGGGLIRDVLASEMPQVLHRGLNATGALFGGAVTLALIATPTQAALAGGLVGALVTGLGHIGWVRMPALGPRG
jgi:uncharacterized membrane protein YeiH